MEGHVLHISTFQVSNLLSSVYITKFVIFKLHFGRTFFLFTYPCLHPIDLKYEYAPIIEY